MALRTDSPPGPTLEMTVEFAKHLPHLKQEKGSLFLKVAFHLGPGRSETPCDPP